MGMLAEMIPVEIKVEEKSVDNLVDESPPTLPPTPGQKKQNENENQNENQNPPCEPCQKCNGPAIWIDGYHQHRCCDCDPPPHESLVVSMIFAEKKTSAKKTWKEIEDQRFVEAIESLSSPPADGKKIFDSRLADRRKAGESEDGIQWRALVDARIELGGWSLGGRRGQKP